VFERSARHQLVIGVKHDAKLRNDYAALFIGNVKFLLAVFFKKYSGVVFCDWK